MRLGETPQSWHDSPKNRSHSEESDSARHVGGAGGQRKLHIVSQRAKQFETGQLEEEENKTHFYRSELARYTHTHASLSLSSRFLLIII